MMATALKPAETIRDRCSTEEWQARVDLAAAYRLVAMYGWDDLIFTHLSARVPGPERGRGTGRCAGGGAARAGAAIARAGG